mmetsp:Transcript_12498/g.24189  ORF Transcript_12498/g.24189 Transcript_12498/m.24189 type:complete len:218 (-) Transcript_12498:75-728(-)
MVVHDSRRHGVLSARIASSVSAVAACGERRDVDGPSAWGEAQGVGGAEGHGRGVAECGRAATEFGFAAAAAAAAAERAAWLCSPSGPNSPPPPSPPCPPATRAARTTAPTRKLPIHAAAAAAAASIANAAADATAAARTAAPVASSHASPAQPPTSPDASEPTDASEHTGPADHARWSWRGRRRPEPARRRAGVARARCCLQAIGYCRRRQEQMELR